MKLYKLTFIEKKTIVKKVSARSYTHAYNLADEIAKNKKLGTHTLRVNLIG